MVIDSKCLHPGSRLSGESPVFRQSTKLQSACFGKKNRGPLKWYYDQKIISFFSSDFESVFA